MTDHRKGVVSRSVEIERSGTDGDHAALCGLTNIADDSGGAFGIAK